MCDINPTSMLAVCGERLSKVALNGIHNLPTKDTPRGTRTDLHTYILYTATCGVHKVTRLCCLW